MHTIEDIKINYRAELSLGFICCEFEEYLRGEYIKVYNDNSELIGWERAYDY